MDRRQRCAHAWAALSRALATYPPTNVRVECQLDIFLQSLSTLLDERRADSVSFTLARGRLQVDGEECEPGPAGPLEWLESRLDRAALSGARFRRGVDRTEVVRFTNHLLELYVRADQTATFDTLWTESFQGVQPVPRRFDGTFGPEVATETDATESDDGLPRGASGPLSTVELLVESPAVRSALRTVRKSLSDIDGEREPMLVADLLRRIVDFLPEEVVATPEALQDVTVAILQGLAHRFERQGLDAGLDELEDDAKLRRLMFVTGRALFGREPTTSADAKQAERRRMLAERAAAESAQQRSLDDRIADDTAALLREFARMPKLRSNPLDELESEVEQLGIYVHYLVREERGPLLDRVEQRLARLLREPRREFVEVLRPYVTSHRFGDEALHWERVESMLRRTRSYKLLRWVGAFTPDSVASSFPADFGTYLATLDHTESEGLEELIEVCAKVGRQGFRDHLPELLSDARLDRPTIWTAMLSQAGAARALPVGSLLLALDEVRYKPLMVDLLRRTRGDEQVAVLLELADTPQAVSSTYLRLLLEHDTGAKPAAALVRQIAQALVTAYHDRVEAHAPETERVEVVERLADFDCEVAREFLRELATAKRFGIFPVAGPVQRAARGVLAGYTR